MENISKFKKQILLKADLMITCFLLLALGGYYLLHVRRPEASAKESRASLEISTTEQRLISYQVSLYFNGTTFPITSGKEVLSDNSTTTKFDERNIVILLSRAGCSPCQVRELKNLDKLYEQFQKKARFISIYLADEVTDSELAKREHRLLQKVSQISFPIWYSTDATLSGYVFYKKYPLIFVIDNQKVVSSFVPIPEDEKFSEGYMKALAYVLSH